MNYLEFMTSAFDRLYRAGGDVWSADGGLRATTDLLARVLPPASSVLDVGCGAGRDTEPLLQMGHCVTGVDLVRHPHWATLEQLYPDRAEFEAIPFQNFEGEGYDAILDNGCFHHQELTARAAYVARVRETLRPGGWYALNVYTPRTEGQSGRDTLLGDGRVAAVYDVARLESHLIGFSLLETRRVRSSVHDGTYLVALARRDV